MTFKENVAVALPGNGHNAGAQAGGRALNTTSTSTAAVEYIRAGWTLFDPGDPKKRLVSTVEEAERMTGSLGLSHAESGLCELYMRDVNRARAWLALCGVDLDALLEDPLSVQIADAEDGWEWEVRLLYRLPAGVKPLQDPKDELYDRGLNLICTKSNASGRGDEPWLPPSVSALSELPWAWKLGPLADWANPPVLPDALLSLWRSLLLGGTESATWHLPTRVASHLPREEIDEAREGLKAIDEKAADKDGVWIEIGRNLHHQTDGAHWAYLLFSEWAFDVTGDLFAAGAAWASFGQGAPAPSDPGALQFQPQWIEDVGVTSETWLVTGVIPASGQGPLWGPSGAGKTFLAIDMALRLATGREVLGVQTKPTGVLYVAFEGVEGVRKRIAAWKAEHGAGDAPFSFLAAPPGLNIANPKHVEQLIDAAKGWAAQFERRGARLGLVVIDTLARAAPGLDENSGADMGAVIDAFDRLGCALNATVMPIHHSGKEQGRGERGHSSFRAAADFSLEVLPRDGDKRSLKLSKSKDGEDGTVWPFHLKIVDLGVGDDGAPITSCVAVVGSPRREPGSQHMAQRLTGNSATIARVLALAIRKKEGSPVAEQDVKPSGLMWLHSDDNADPDKAARTAWSRAVKDLLEMEIITRTNGMIAMAGFTIDQITSPAASGELQELRNLIQRSWEAGGQRRDGAGRPVVPEATVAMVVEAEGRRAPGAAKAEARNRLHAAWVAGLIERASAGHWVLTSGAPQPTPRGGAVDPREHGNTAEHGWNTGNSVPAEHGTRVTPPYKGVATVPLRCSREPVALETLASGFVEQ